ncbi:MAG: DNA internalization-related competence protein ComEC/Rec2 [Myxococcales bacterium]|nr:DNA internalization-related competence protein ComEC/Rec2 [Myxococcales bacterium]
MQRHIHPTPLDSPPTKPHTRPWHAFVAWLVFFLGGLTSSLFFHASTSFWLLWLLVAFVMTSLPSRSPSRTLLGFTMLAFTLGGLSPPLARQRQQRTMHPNTPSLLAKRIFFEGILLQSLTPRRIPPYRYPLPKRLSYRTDRHCAHPSSSDLDDEDDTFLGSAPFLLRRFATQAQGPWKELHEKILLRVVGKRSFVRGQWLRLRLKLKKPRRYANPGQSDPWKQFAAEGMRYTASVNAPSIVALAPPRPPPLLAGLDHWREQAQRTLRRYVHSSKAQGLFFALLLGDKTKLSPQLKQDFAKTGTSHLLAISGLHLALVGGCFFWLGSWLLRRIPRLLLRDSPRRWAALLTLPPCFMYAFLSGPSTSTLRALLMLTLYFLAMCFSRRHRGFRGLLLAACLLLFFDPTALSTPSFLLSFGSVFWLMVLGESVLSSRSPTLSDNPPRRWLRRLSLWLFLPMASSFLVMMATLPVSLGFSPYLPLHGPLVNLVAIPLCGFGCVALGLVGLFFAGFAPFLAEACFFLAEKSALILLAWVRWGATQQQITLELPPLRPTEMIALYLGLFALAFCKKIPKISLVLTASCALFLLLPQFPISSLLQDKDRLRIDFLDVGQGDATLIRFPDGTTMLVDAGGEAFAPVDVGERAILPYLRHQRIKKIDYAVLSHPHPDHFGGFLTLMQRFPVGEFWHTGQHGSHPHDRLLRRFLRQRRIPQRTFCRPTTYAIGEVRVDILHPYPGPHEGSTYYWALHANDNSLVLLLTYKKIRILLTGDIEEHAEEILTKRYPHLRADILKVPHHGSRTSSTARLLDHIRPKHALFGMGRRNLFRFPHPSTYQRYKQRKIRIWRTDQHGLIQIKTDGRTLSISPTL